VDEKNLQLRFFENRIVSLDIKFNRNNISIIKIYAPNLREEQRTLNL